MQVASLIIDFGLVILIWMTQLIVYPSFKYYSTEQLLDWHGKYTQAISFIVMPLMLSQLSLHTLAMLTDLGASNILAAILIFLIWVNTFLFAVPLHNQISKNIETKDATQRLVKINWYRTIMWTLIFALSLIEIIIRMDKYD